MRKIQLFFPIIISFFLFSCSTQKNTAITRAFHNLNAHYNVYFNGLISFEEGISKIENSYKYDYNQLLPFFDYSLDEQTQLANSDMNTTLEKMGKTIAVHSITVKPILKGKPSPKDRELMQKAEYCNWIDDAYLLIGKANLYNRDYSKSLRALRRIINVYKTEDTRFDAELWIAKVYIQQQKYSDALNYLTNIENDVRHPKKLDLEINMTFADYFAKKHNYPDAILRVQKAISLAKNKKIKAKLYFILAQLESLNNQDNKASEYYKKVIKMNPDYDMTFNAKIKRATVFTKGQNSAEIKKQLKKLLKDEKNEDYKDQIYFAMATISLKDNDTTNAIRLFKLSAQKSISNDNQKAISFLSLADIFFKQKKFLPSGEYYDSTMQYLSKKYPNYEKISKRANSTGILLNSLGEVQNQDSLQRIASMSDENRLKFIDDLIKQYIDQEQKQLQAQNNNNNFDPYDNNFNNQANVNSQDGKWYMYNPVLVSRGQNEFKKKWGTRKLEDNWRRRNKNSVIEDDNTDNSKDKKDSTKITDKKSREYYLQNLPLSDSLLKISDKKIENNLFTAAEVYQNLLGDYNSSISTYENIIKRFPETNLKLEIYYRLYKLYKLANNSTKANFYSDLIIIKFPKSNYAKALQDPNYITKLMSNQDIILNLYSNALAKYNSFDYLNSLNLCNQGLSKYPGSDAYPNFLFLKGKNLGSIGQQDSMLYYLNLVSNKYPDLKIGKLALDIINIVKSGKFNYDIYKLNLNDNHDVIVILNKNLNTTEFRFKIKFQTENFSDIKTFNIKSDKFDKKNDIVTISQFENGQEAMSFYNRIIKSDVLEGLNKTDYFLFAISETNLKIFLKDQIIDKYSIFFTKNYE